jgi:hypothetical protein
MKKPFKKLSPAQKRVAIAKDVLKQIKRERYDIKLGSFGSLPEYEYHEDAEKIVANRKFFQKEDPRCDVCAVGAAICSGIRLFNKVSFTAMGLDSDLSYQLIQNFFSDEQAVLIENAFELGDGAFTPNEIDEIADLPEIDTDAAIEFGSNFENRTERAVAIFSNIIRNKGEFIP